LYICIAKIEKLTVKENIRALLAEKCVGIAGAGGLGSNVAAALVRSGVGHLVVADFDTVSPENMDRQFYFANQAGSPKVYALHENLQRINAGTKFTMFYGRVTTGNVRQLFSGCHVVVEAFDLAEEKEWFAVWMTKNLSHIPLIMGSGIAGWGHSEKIRVQRSGNLYVCGHQFETNENEVPLMAPHVGLVAMMQADIVLEILLTKKAPSL
jgi:sulfur carrier protein ThiS adenylyltransferase